MIHFDEETISTRCIIGCPEWTGDASSSSLQSVIARNITASKHTYISCKHVYYCKDVKC
jgi:hypothetical protein